MRVIFLRRIFKMAKAKFERTKPHCNIGTIGHVDHGKTNAIRNFGTQRFTILEEYGNRAER